MDPARANGGMAATGKQDNLVLKATKDSIVQAITALASVPTIKKAIEEGDFGAVVDEGNKVAASSIKSAFDIRDGPGSVTIRQFSYYDFDTPYGEDLAILVRLVTTGRLHPEIGRLADWSDTATTLTDLYQRRIRGNAVLTIS